jgi:hypothetical protein
MRHKLKNLYFLSPARGSAWSEFTTPVFLNRYLRPLKLLESTVVPSQLYQITSAFTIILNVSRNRLFRNLICGTLDVKWFEHSASQIISWESVDFYFYVI